MKIIFFRNSKIVLLFFSIFFLFNFISVNASIISTNGTGGGNWADLSTWVGGVVPGPDDQAVVASNDHINEVPIGSFCLTNNGVVDNNYGTINTNNGVVNNNAGLITDNYGSINHWNSGSLTNNYAVLSVGLADGSTITNNYGTVSGIAIGSRVINNLQGVITENGGTVDVNNGDLVINNPGGVVITNSGTISGGTFYSFVINDNGIINNSQLCQTEESTTGTVNNSNFGINEPSCYNYVPPPLPVSVSITSPASLSVVSFWSPEVAFNNATVCQYKFDQEDFNIVDCNAPTILAPTEWPHTLTILADDVASSTVSFIYATLLGDFTGALTTTEPPTPTYHTLEDIYEVVTSGTPSVSGGHSLSPLSAPQKSMHSVSEIYIALANLIDASKIKSTVTYLGVTGGQSTPTPLEPIASPFEPDTIAGAVTGFTLDDIYHLIKDNNRITVPSHSFGPVAGPVDLTGHSIEDIYRILTALIQPGNLLAGETYLGVAGKHLDQEFPYVTLADNSKLYIYPMDNSLTAPWGCRGTSIPTAQSTTEGLANTEEIIENCPNTDIAARICSDLIFNDYDDWYLPAQNQLYRVYTEITAGRLNKGDYEGEWIDFLQDNYWTSTEGVAFPENYSMNVQFNNGYVGDNPKNSTSLITRCVRKD